jgi:uncharacterized protein (TIGR03435 family)
VTRKLASLVVLACFTAPFADAQSPEEFEVASIKKNTSSNGWRGGCHGIDSKSVADGLQATIPLGRCVISGALLTHLIAIAYGIQVQNIKGGPDWVRESPRFDVEAKAENASATAEQLLLMLQNLLADRFRLKLHRETIERAGYELVTAKNGLKLKESSGDGEGVLRITGANIFKPDAIERKNLDQNTITAVRTTMSQLATALANLPESGPVIDQTGLKGFYDFRLAWEPGESLSSVLQQQLGLKLEGRKVPVEVLFIDSAEKPSKN